MDGRKGNVESSLKVMITSAYDGEGPVHAFREYAARDRFRVHATTEDASEADLILFVEHHRIDEDRDYVGLCSHPLVRHFREKCFMYNEQDRPWCVLPGLYCSMPRRYFNRSRQRAGCYVHRMNPYVAYADPADNDPDLLYSFIGNQNCQVRGTILALEDPRGHMARTTTAHNVWRPHGPEDDPHLPLRTYADVLRQSKFVLCPRGVGTSTFRLFETMCAARVPVILSDQWVPPDGPDWTRCSLRVSEREAHRLPDLLREAEPRWRELAVSARKEWEEWFAPEVLFHRWTEACVDIQSERHFPEAVSQRIPQPIWLERRVRRMASPLKRVVRSSKAAMKARQRQ